MFAPVFKPGGRPTSLVRRQRLERKRKREGKESDDDSESSNASSPDQESFARTPTTSSYHPVNRTDQYYVAGYPRERPTPAFPFPHAAEKSTKTTTLLADEELAKLNPPLYVPRATQSTSLGRQHVENLTAILHSLMLKGDWKRASRTWGLLLRSEIGGRGIDIRQHGRWAIGAELLMRREQEFQPRSEDDSSPAPETTPREENKFIPDQGFRLARDYYERLILQFPHTARTRHPFSALVVYPAMFNIWLYEVQEKSKRARQAASSERQSSPASDRSNSSTSSSVRNTRKEARAHELEEGSTIAQRMDELLLSPPYDTSIPLLRLRGMVGLWLADLHDELGQANAADDSDPDIRPQGDRQTEVVRSRVEAELNTAFRLFAKVDEGGGPLPEHIKRTLNERKKLMS